MTEILHLTENRKVKFGPNVKNTVGFNYGLPEHGGTCSGATTGKGGCLETRDGKKNPTCYMHKITQIYPNVGKRLKENTDKMENADLEGKIRLLDNTITSFKLHTKKEWWKFRCNYSGDIKDEQWAKAWLHVIQKHSDVFFWNYTRSHQFAHMFAGLPNMSLFLSIDPSNESKVLATYETLKHHNNIALAYMGNQGQPKDYKFVKCPEVTGVLKNTDESGACSRCLLCVDGCGTKKLRNISFNIH